MLINSNSLVETQQVETQDLKEIYAELSQLAQLVIEDTLEKLKEYFKKQQVEKFEEKATKAAKYKNGYILKLFLERVGKLTNLTDIQHQMIKQVKQMVA
jgi:ribosomal protein S18